MLQDIIMLVNYRMVLHRYLNMLNIVMNFMIKNVNSFINKIKTGIEKKFYTSKSSDKFKEVNNKLEQLNYKNLINYQLKKKS